MKTKYLEIWVLHLIQKKIIMNLKKTVSAFSNNYIQYEDNLRDKDKILLPRDYLDVIRPYLSHMINNHKTQGE